MSVNIKKYNIYFIFYIIRIVNTNSKFKKYLDALEVTGRGTTSAPTRYFVFLLIDWLIFISHIVIGGRPVANCLLVQFWTIVYLLEIWKKHNILIVQRGNLKSRVVNAVTRLVDHRDDIHELLKIVTSILKVPYNY